MRPYYLCNHLQVFTFHEWGFPNSTSSHIASCCSWMKFKQRMGPNQHLQRMFYERPSCNRKQPVLVAGGGSPFWGGPELGGCGSESPVMLEVKHHVSGRHGATPKTGKSQAEKGWASSELDSASVFGYKIGWLFHVSVLVSLNTV